jgi:hypothetical protein
MIGEMSRSPATVLIAWLMSSILWIFFIAHTAQDMFAYVLLLIQSTLINGDYEVI